MFSRKNLLRILINTGIGAVLIWFWLQSVNLHEVTEVLSKVQLNILIFFVFFYILSSALRAWRLKIFLRLNKLSLRNLTFLSFLSQLLSFIIPIRVGEVTKGVYLSTHLDIPFARSLIWVFLDRFWDFWMVLVMVSALLIVVPLAVPSGLEQIIIISVVTLTIGLIITFVFPEAIRKLAEVFSKLLIIPMVKKVFLKISTFVIESIISLKRGKKEMLSIMLVTLLALISDAFMWFLVFAAIFPQVDFIQILLGSGMSMLTYLVPSAPGYVGSAEASALAVFGFLLGIDKTIVSAAAILNHGSIFVCLLLFGLLGLYLLKFDMSLVWQKLKRS